MAEEEEGEELPGSQNISQKQFGDYYDILRKENPYLQRADVARRRSAGAGLPGSGGGDIVAAAGGAAEEGAAVSGEILNRQHMGAPGMERSRIDPPKQTWQA